MWSLLALLAILWNYGNCQVCVTDSLDLAFILDASTSVTEPNFRRMLQFVQNIVSELDIDSGATRVALLTFSTNTKIQYNLGEISNKAEFIDKIRTISYDYGSTNTADALVAMRTKVFSKSRDRPHVPNVAILITDGISNINGQRTVTDAEDARAAGITIVGVGIALTDTSELDRIVSQPVEKYKYSVDEFDKLDEIAKLLLTMDCKEAPDTDRPDATIDLYQGIGSNPADIVFLLDTSTSNDVDLYNKIRSFLVHFVESSSVESGEVRFAFVPYTNYPDVKFYLNKYSRKADIVTAIRDATFNYGERNTADAFDLLRRQVFTEGNGDRPQVPNIVLMITTGTSDRNSFRTIQEAEALRFAGVGIFAIGIGLTNAREIEAMASRPTRENTFQLASVDELEAIRDIVFAQIFTRAEQSFKSPVTGSEQLDLIFLLHFSNNMRKESLNLVLDFVQNLLEYADIDSGQVRVGISIYRKTATSLYNLDRFSTKGELMEGIEQITTQYKAKAANTAAGLDFLRTDMFVEKAGDRPNVPNAVIIITDANTNVDQADAITAAEALKATGTAIFSIGIGLENPDELDALATSRDFSLALTQTSELNSNTIYIQDRIVALRTQADLPMPPPTITSPTFTKTAASALDIRNTRRPPALVENREEADVVLAFHCSKETKVKDFKKGLFTLFSELVSSADVDSGAVRFALVGYGQNASVIFGFNSYQRKKKLLKALKKVKATYRSKESNALDLILKLKTEVFSTSQGDRTGVPNIMILVTDSPTTAPVTEVGKNAKVLKDMGISVFSIGVEKADPMEISAMASEPISKYSYSAGTYYEMLNSADLKEKLSKAYPVFAGIGSPTDVSTTKKPGKKTKPTGTPIKKTKGTVKPQKKTITTSRADVVQETTTVAYKTSVMKTDIPTNRTVFSDLVKLLETSPYMEAITASVVRDTYTALPDTKEVITDGENLSRNLTTKSLLSQNVAPPISGSEKADIVFALHLSDRANAREVRTVLNYLNSLISGSDVENGRVKIGLLTYNADAEVIFNINQYNSVPLIRNEVLRIESRTRSSNVDASAALSVGTQMLNVLYSGRSDAPKALIFVTDSVSTENTELIPFERFRVESEQVNVFSVGIGLNGKEELEDLATAPENVLTVSRYSELPSTIDDLKRKIFAFRTRDDKAVPEPEEPRITKPEEPIRTLAPPRQEASGITLVPRNPCADAQVDLVYILDASTSVTEVNFKKMLDFCKQLLEDADINNGNVQVGVVVYSSDVRTEFYLNRYKTRSDVMDAIGRIKYTYGSTNTAGGLKTMREELFSFRNGDRSDVPNVAIILTDGVSNINAGRTIPEAELARAEGIHIYAIGIGLTDTRELDAIASHPASQNSFSVRSFDELKAIKQKVFSSLCPGETTRTTTRKPTTPKPTTQKPTTTTKATTTTTKPTTPKPTPSTTKSTTTKATTPKPTTPKPTPTTTKSTTKATTPKPTTPRPTTITTRRTTTTPRRDGYDLVMVLDSSVNSTTFNWMMDVTKNTIRELNIDDEEWRVGIVTYSTNPNREFNLNQYKKKADVLRQVDRISYRPGQTNTASALKYVRTNMFRESNGDRNFAKNYVILITGNEKSQDMYAAAEESYQMQRDGVATYVIGLGINDKTELDELASLPLADYEVIIPAPNQIGETPGEVIYNIRSRSPTPNPPPQRPPRPRSTPGPVLPLEDLVCKSTGDIVFVLDSSGSVGLENFYRVLNFTYNTVNQLDIESGNYSVGLVTFSDSARIEFYLNTYKKRGEIQPALQKVRYVYGSTHTAAALRRVRQELFRAEVGDRPDVPNIVVIVTDGNSNVNHEMTLVEADMLKRAGVSMITVAVGFQRETRELVGLTSAPVEQNLIYADEYRSLDKLSRKLLEPLCTDSDLCRTTRPCRNDAICVDGIRSYMCLCPESYYGTNCEKQCSEPADVAFILDSSNTVGESSFQRMKDYVGSLIMEMNVEACNINVGLMKYSSAPMIQWGLGTYRDTDANIRAVNQVHYTRGVANMAAALKSLRTDIFNGRGGDRPKAKNIAYLLTDGSNKVHEEETQKNAELAISSGIRIIPVGVSLRDREDVDLIAGAQDLNTIILDENIGEINEVALAPMVRAKDYCAGNPCKNGGKCLNESFGFICECPAGFTGEDCTRRCSAGGDVVFVVDTSRYVTRKEMKRVRHFLRSVVKRLRFKEFKTGLVQYSNTANVVLTFADGDKKKNVLTAIAGLRNMVGDPDPAEALAKANFRIFKGDGAMADQPDYLVLLSKGLKNDQDLLIQSNRLKMRGTRILGVGVALTGSERELMESVVSYPSSNTAYYADDVEGLDDVADKVVEFMCNGQDKCAQNPCQNKGKCHVIGAEYYCDCPHGFAGKNCELKCDAKADIVFLLDSSGSVGHVDFRKVKDFAYRMIDDLNIGKDETRVGLVAYSSRSRHGFYLKDYYEKYELQNAISSIEFEYGKTNTADGLRHVREKLFNSAVGDRPDAQNFVVVITDGLSNIKSEQTIVEADLMKSNGVHVYAIGIGKFDRYEIDRIASAPASKNAFILEDYASLASISSDIIRATCKDPSVCDENPCRNDGRCEPTMNGPICKCTGGYRGPYCEMSCVSRKDIIFVLDSSSSVGEENFELALEFVSSVVEELSRGGSDNRYAMITFSNDVELVFSLGRYSSAGIILNAIKYTRYRPGSTNTAGGLRTALEISSPEYGDRKDVDNIVILVADGQSNVNTQDTIPAADDLKKTGAKIITIGVGLSNYKELETIGSGSENVYKVDTYNLLGDVKADILENSCSENE